MSFFPFYPANISTSDQRCFNVINQRWNNSDPHSTLYNVDTTWVSDVETTLGQGYFNVFSTLVKATLKQIGWYNVISTLWIDK